MKEAKTYNENFRAENNTNNINKNNCRGHRNLLQ